MNERLITKREDLDALPDGSVVLDSAGLRQFSVFTKDTYPGYDKSDWWQCGSEQRADTIEIQLPATLLWEGAGDDLA